MPQQKTEVYTNKQANDNLQKSYVRDMEPGSRSEKGVT